LTSLTDVEEFILTPHSSWVTRFFKVKFELEDGVLGTLFFVTSIIAACSMLVASSISKRIGNVKVSPPEPLL
jgi:hypothetical protein